MQAEAERLKREEILQSGEDQHSLDRENNKITIVLSSTFSTRREDVTSKESFDKVKIRLSEINKHVSDGINKDREKGAKEFSKSEAEWVDAMDTLQHAQSLRRR